MHSTSVDGAVFPTSMATRGTIGIMAMRLAISQVRDATIMSTRADVGKIAIGLHMADLDMKTMLEGLMKAVQDSGAVGMMSMSRPSCSRAAV